MKYSHLAYLRDTLGFDLTKHIPFTREYRIRCSQCAAVAINNTACHENGCPNATRECKGCNARIPANRSRFNPYCEDCL